MDIRATFALNTLGMVLTWPGVDLIAVRRVPKDEGARETGPRTQVYQDAFRGPMTRPSTSSQIAASLSLSLSLASQTPRCRLCSQSLGLTSPPESRLPTRRYAVGSCDASTPWPSHVLGTHSASTMTICSPTKDQASKSPMHGLVSPPQDSTRPRSSPLSCPTRSRHRLSLQDSLPAASPIPSLVTASQQLQLPDVRPLLYARA